jgi:hypothetical protein
MSFAKFTQATLLFVSRVASGPLSRAQTYTVLYAITAGSLAATSTIAKEKAAE